MTIQVAATKREKKNEEKLKPKVCTYDMQRMESWKGEKIQRVAAKEEEVQEEGEKKESLPKAKTRTCSESGPTPNKTLSLMCEKQTA